MGKSQDSKSNKIKYKILSLLHTLGREKTGQLIPLYWAPQPLSAEAGPLRKKNVQRPVHQPWAG